MIQKCVVLGVFVMASTLAFLGVLTTAVTINNQMNVITTDCYERQASGQRLHASDVYKTIKVNLLQDCQIACTEEKEICRSFSYGNNTKESPSCEMSSKIIKETADLKPIGTVNDTNYDLYIKKTGCKLVIELNKNKSNAQQHNQTQNTYNTALFDQYDDSPSNSQNRPFYDYEDLEYDYRRPGYGFMYAPNFYGPPIKVQSSLISISPIVGETNELNENERKNYKDQHYFDYNDKQENSLDFINRLSNYNKQRPFYVEESDYEQHSNHFSVSSHEYTLPLPEKDDNTYSPQRNRPLYNDLAYDEYLASMSRPTNNERYLSDGSILNYKNYENRKAEVLNNQPNRYDNWPSYPFIPTYSEFTYGNRYSHYKQSQDKLQHTQELPNEGLSTNKITSPNFTSTVNYTEINNTSSISFGNGSIVSQRKGPHGETITSIITELKAGELVLVCHLEVIQEMHQ